ncbi:uncharacterized protein [Nicotiana tomentosiformis]|uniref:uncharacterized protein n=1 Tax=Nicotiana tomentosiformis TaxID=4098 RepID=UPI00388C63C6
MVIDPSYTLSYVTTFIDTKFGIEPEAIKPFEVANLVGNSVVPRRVFRGCTVVIGDRSTTTVLTELEMVDFDVIFCTGWLSSCYANVECRGKTVQFNFPEGSAIEWKGVFASPKGRFISYLKTMKMIAKGILTVESIPVVNMLPHVFTDKLPSLSPKREIDFPTDIVSVTQPIYTPPNRMASA